MFETKDYALIGFLFCRGWNDVDIKKKGNEVFVCFSDYCRQDVRLFEDMTAGAMVQGLKRARALIKASK